MYFIGLMSGTSMDAIDVALVNFNEKADLKFYREYPIDNALRHQIRLVNEKSELGHIAELDNVLGHLFAESVNRLLEEAKLKPEEINAIGSHGQTILHRPNLSHTTSLQIADPNIICTETGITTVADFRRMDMANGGQGAPLACAFHQYQFQQANKSIAVLNIGGMANLTLLPGDDNKVIGFDTGPGNALLDDWIQLNKNEEYDKDGIWAETGRVHDQLLGFLLSDPYFSVPSPKSTGREYFNLEWLKSYLNKLDLNIKPEDIQASLLELSIQTISDEINYHPNIKEVLACGGGAYNRVFMDKLRKKIPDKKLLTTEQYGLSPNCIEAVTFAWLAKQRIEQKTANLPEVTGATKRAILGGIYSPS